MRFHAPVKTKEERTETESMFKKQQLTRELFKGTKDSLPFPHRPHT